MKDIVERIKEDRGKVIEMNRSFLEQHRGATIVFTKKSKNPAFAFYTNPVFAHEKQHEEEVRAFFASLTEEIGDTL